MMRDDIFKKILQGNRPEPTPAFADSVRTALAQLPDRKKKPAAARVLPRIAIAVAAVAIACFLAVHFNALGWLLNSSTQDYAGQPAVTPDPRVSFDALSPCKDNGVTETVDYACLNNDILYFTLDTTPLPEQSMLYKQDATFVVNGVGHRTISIGGESGIEVCSMGDDFPVGPVSGKTVHVVIDCTVESYPLDTDFNTIDPDTQHGKHVATFHHEFDLAVTYTQQTIRASGFGEFGGGKARLTGVYETPDLLTVTLAVNDNGSNYLDTFINNQERTDALGYVAKTDSIEYLVVTCFKGLITDDAAAQASANSIDYKYMPVLKRLPDGTFTLTVYLTPANVDLKQGLTIGTIDYTQDNSQSRHFKYFYIKQSGN
jgi:hypothetical protein